MWKSNHANYESPATRSKKGQELTLEASQPAKFGGGHKMVLGPGSGMGGPGIGGTGLGGTGLGMLPGLDLRR